MSGSTQQGRVMRAVVNYGLGGMAPKIVNFLLLPLYTVFVDPESFGKLEIFFGAQAFLLVLMRGGLPSAVARLFFDDRTAEEFGSLVFSTFVAALVITVPVCAAFIFGFPYIADAFFDIGTLWPWVQLTCLGAITRVFVEFQRRLLQAKEESSLAARLGASQAILTTILSLTLVMGFKLGGLGIMLSSSFSATVFGVIGLLYLRPYFRFPFSGSLLREAAQYAAPLVPHHAMATIFQNAGRWVLAAYGSVAVTGHLAFAGRLTSPLVMVTGAFAAAFSPVYFAWRSKLSDDECQTEVRRVGTSVVTLGAILAISVTLGSVLVVRHFVADTYAPALFLIGPLALAQYLQLVYTVFVVEVFCSKRTKLIPFMLIWGAGVNIAALFVLVPRYDGVGAVLAQVLGSAVSAMVAGIFARQTFVSPITARPLLMSALSIAGCCFLVTVLPQFGLVGDAAMVAVAWAGLTLLSVLLAGTLGSIRGDVTWLYAKIKQRLRPAK